MLGFRCSADEERVRRLALSFERLLQVGLIDVGVADHVEPALRRVDDAIERDVLVTIRSLIRTLLA